MTLREFFAALGRRKRLLAGGVLLSLLVGGFIGFTVGSEQRAQAEILLVQPQPGASAEASLLTQQKLNLLAFTYAEIVRSDRFVERALSAAGVTRSGASVSGRTVKNTSILQIEVRAGDGDAAREVAEALTDSLVAELERPELDLPSSGELVALVLEEPVAKSSASNGAFALFAALVAGVALSATAAVLLETP